MVATVVTRPRRIIRIIVGLYIWVLANGSIQTVQAQQCTAGYVEMSGRCLRVVNVNRRWSEAQRDCSNTGGRLASVLADTDPVMTAVGQISGAGRVWIGLKKTRTDWQYTTVSGDNRFIQRQGCYLDVNTYDEFTERTGTGNQYTPQQCMQDCRTRDRRYAGILRWNRADLPLECRCSDRFTIDRIKITPCVWPCPSNSSFYCAGNFNDAARFSLMVFRLQQVYSSFDAWKHGQPNNYGNVMSYQSCNALDVADRSSSGWNDQNCAQTTFWTGQMQRYGHICRYEVSNQAQCRHAYIANRCITVHINSAMSWYDARRSCLDAGGDILRVDDVDILDRLTGWFSEHSRWWIDGVNEIWNWDDGRQLGRYTNWISNRPVSDANMCVALASQSSWQWAEEHCNSPYPYICETDIHRTTTTTTTTTSERSTTTKTTTRKTDSPPVVVASSTTSSRDPRTSPPTVPSKTTMFMSPSPYSVSRGTAASPSSSKGTPHLPMMSTADSDASILNVTTITMTVAPSTDSRENWTAGTISSLVITIFVMVITTARMLASCCWDKTQRDDAFN